MNNHPARIGNFTSSEIGNLMTYAKNKVDFGKPALTYIEETNMERRLGRALTTETDARATSWGKHVESRVFNLLGMEYELLGDQTLIHPEIEYWSGSPDAKKEREYTNEAIGKTVGEIKCPMTLKSFCQVIDCIPPKGIGENSLDVGLLIMQAVRENHPKGDLWFWQMVSNAILVGARYAELIIYVPYQRELVEIRDAAANFDGDQNKIAWLGWATDDDLPYLIEGKHYKNLNTIRFEVPEEDKNALTARVLQAGEKLIKLK